MAFNSSMWNIDNVTMLLKESSDDNDADTEEGTENDHTGTTLKVIPISAPPMVRYLIYAAAGLGVICLIVLVYCCCCSTKTKNKTVISSKSKKSKKNSKK